MLLDRELERARAELGRVDEVKEQLQTEDLEEINLKGGELERARAELRRANEAKEQLQSTPRSVPLAAELPSNVLVVVGGKLNAWDMCAYTEIARITRRF